MSASSAIQGDTKRPLPGSVTALGWVLVAVGVAIVAMGYAVDARQAAFNNVILFLFIISIAAGALFLVALEHLTGAVWSVPMRRVAEFLAWLVPVAALVAVPLLFNLHDVYHWTHPEAVAADKLLSAKEPYLNEPFFIGRFVAVFLLLLLFVWLFTRNSLKQDTSKDQRLSRINAGLAAAFLPVFAISITVISVDWGMSLEPHWFSTIYGVYFFSGTVLAGVAAATFIIVRLSEQGYLKGLTRDHFYSLGALLFAFVNFWAYIAFSQFMLIWYANLPEETFWFIARWEGGWQWVSIGLIVVQFAIPYLVLLPQEAKMDPRRLKVMAIWLLFAHLYDIYWLVMPTFSTEVVVGWMELGFPVLAVGLVIVVLSWKMKRHNLMPVGDPKLARAMDFHL